LSHTQSLTVGRIGGDRVLTFEMVLPFKVYDVI